MSNYPELVYWLALIQGSDLKLNLVKPIIQRWCVVEQRSLADLFDLSPLEWSTTFGLSDAEANQASAAGEKLAQQAAALADWQAQGIELLLRTDPRYPRRLAQTLPLAKQPLLLWARGAVELLNEPGVAMLGSQEPDEAAAKFIQELVSTLVTEEICLVSGYGRGLDRATFEALLATRSGRAITVLPMGLSAFAQTTSKLGSGIETRRIVLVSPFTPPTPFQDKLAEARNLLIDHLALTLLIPHADEDAQARAAAAISRGLPVFVGLTDTAGNRALIDQGALLLTDSGEVVEMVQQAMIDLALLDSPEAAPAEFVPVPSAPLTPAPPARVNEDYALRPVEVEPIDRDEALEILSMGGKVPDILRQRLQQASDDEPGGSQLEL